MKNTFKVIQSYVHVHAMLQASRILDSHKTLIKSTQNSTHFYT